MTIGGSRAIRDVVVIVVLMGTALGCDRTVAPPSPSSESVVPATPTPVAPAPSVAASNDAGLVLGSIEEPLPHVYGGSLASAAVRFAGGFLAFGYVNGGCCDASFSTETRGVIWISADGSAWELAPTGAEFSLAHIEAAAASDERVVLAGTLLLQSPTEPGAVERHGATWTSLDGATWTRTDDVPAFSTLIAVPGGFVAASPTKAAPELWWSGDGAAWQPIAGQQELGNGLIRRLLATPDGFFAVGSAVNEDATGVSAGPLGPPAAVWQSSDGMAWSRLEQIPDFIGASMRDVAWSDGRLLAVGWGGDIPAIWATSASHGDWQRLAFPAAPGTAVALQTVVGLPHGFAVTGSWSSVADEAANGVALWSTQDGTSWQTEQLQPSWEINAWLPTDDGAVALGWGCRPSVECPVPLAWSLPSLP